MKNEQSTSTARPASSNNRKGTRVGNFSAGANPLVLISLLLLLCGDLQLKTRAQAIRGEPINAPAQTNSVPAANPPPSPSGTNAPPIKGGGSDTPRVADDSKADHFVAAGFDKLSSFHLELPGEAADPSGNPEPASQKINDQIPVTVKSLNDKEVRTQGFMLPLRMKDGLAVDFLLLKNQMACCYGGTPGLNEWIQVRTSGKGIRPVMDEPITVFGTLHVGAIRESGYVNGIYQMDCDKIEVPLRH